MRSIPSMTISRPAPGRAMPLAGDVLIAACIACPSAALAQSVAGGDLPHIDVWGSAVGARERSEQSAFEARADDDAARPQLRRSVSLQQARWGGATALPQSGGPDDVVRRGAVAVAAPVVQAADISLRWGLGTARSAVDVGIGAGAYRVRPGEGPDAQAGSPSISNGSGAEGRRDALVPTLSVGLRHSLSDAQRLSVYAGGSASVSPASVGEFYTTKVKVEWLPTRNSSLGFEHAAVNLRFGPTSNFALRVRHGGPMIYYRSTF